MCGKAISQNKKTAVTVSVCVCVVCDDAAKFFDLLLCVVPLAITLFLEQVSQNNPKAII